MFSAKLQQKPPSADKFDYASRQTSLCTLLRTKLQQKLSAVDYWLQGINTNLQFIPEEQLETEQPTLGMIIVDYGSTENSLMVTVGEQYTVFHNECPNFKTLFIFLQPRTPNEWNLYHVKGRGLELHMIAAKFHY